MTEWILAFDLSLKAPAAVALPRDWRPGDWKRVKSWLARPKVPEGGDLTGEVQRYMAIAEWAEGVISDVIRGQHAQEVHAYVEAYGFKKNNSWASRLMESGGVVKATVYMRHAMILTPVNASTARKLLLGKLPRSDQKIAVQRAVFAAKAPKTWEENICDAFVVCNFGLSEMGGVAMTLAER